MIRPSRRLLACGLAALCVTVLTVAFGPYRAGAAAAWAAVAVVVLADLALSPGSRRLAVTARAPAELFTGESGDIVVTVSGRHGVGTSRRLCGRLAYPEGLAGAVEALSSDAGASQELRLRVTARRRGVWPVDRFWLDWTSRFGLIEYSHRAALGVAIMVSPNIRRVRSGEIDAAVRSALYGTKENFLVGEGSEFHQLRDFSRGMDPRSIDWKRSARHRGLLGKEMRAERNHSIVMALDNGYLMREEIAGLPKVDHHIAAMLSLAWAGVLGGDRIGLFAFDARPRVFEPPAGGRGAFTKLRAAAARLEYRSVETNFTLAMAHLHERLRRRSLIVVFSDFVDATTAELMIENVAMLNRQHLIVFATLRDPVLRALADGPPDSLGDVARAVSAAQMLHQRRLVFERLARLGVLCIEADQQALTGRLISTYFTIKAREMV